LRIATERCVEEARVCVYLVGELDNLLFGDVVGLPRCSPDVPVESPGKRGSPMQLLKECGPFRALFLGKLVQILDDMFDLLDQLPFPQVRYSKLGEGCNDKRAQTGDERELVRMLDHLASCFHALVGLKGRQGLM